ncbi:sigma-54 dependent transcriptional regulator [uncultured Marinobacter sp.]|uniref:sigma-54-dependent transcriptional regulator n=1 Tax=uncultured Marinobacter sp. TaxID=187379 RepID=UPI0026305681|nr:sigma-54 dependent transcriptional regulator [uncultured Marinobacter sp.]
MQEKRPLVWLSATSADKPLNPALLSQWNIHPFDLTEPPPFGLAGAGKTRVGVLDLSTYPDQGTPYLDQWIEAFQIPYWVGILPSPPHQNTPPGTLISRHCTDYHTLPLDPDRLNTVIGHLWGMAQLQRQSGAEPQDSYREAALEGASQAIRQVRAMLRRFAKTQEPVLIFGENGTGKDTAARFIHAHSSRSTHPMVTVNCAALPVSLTQSELFGYEKGAFTHALDSRRGRLESADGGTLLLSGIDELVPEQQSAILRFLQDGQIERIGGSQSRKVDVRVIATSSRPLKKLVETEEFRSDVYYRLGSLEVQLPALRDRPEDIPIVANKLLANIHTAFGVRKLSNQAMQSLALHDWPGNLRELQNRLRQAMLLSESAMIEPADLGLAELTASSPGKSGLSLEAFRARADRQALTCSLELSHQNVSAAARILNISRVSFYRLMDKYGPHNQPRQDKPLRNHH